MTAENKLTIGEWLKQGRLRQHLTLEECTKRTHIAVRFLTALEAEQWKELPSESHRLGFLRNYSRFLGIPTDEILTLYRQVTSPPSEKPVPPRVNPLKMGLDLGGGWSTPSWSQLLGFGILALVLSWLIYHAISRQGSESGPPLLSRRPMVQQTRLVVPKPSIAIQRIRVKAQGDSWMRILSGRQLFFEGILPAGSTKEWSGNGPFQLKIGNIRTLSVFWNDQPVDIQAGARGGMNEIQLPPQ